MAFLPEHMCIPCPTSGPLWDMEEARHQEYLRRAIRAQELYKHRDDSPEAGKLYKIFVNEHNSWMAAQHQLQLQEYSYARQVYGLRAERWKQDWEDVARGLASPSEFTWNSSSQPHHTYDEWKGVSTPSRASVRSMARCVSPPSTIGTITNVSSIVEPNIDASKPKIHRRLPLDGLFDNTLNEIQNNNAEDDREFSEPEFYDSPVRIDGEVEEALDESLTPPVDLLTSGSMDFVPAIASQRSLSGGDIIKVVDHKNVGKKSQDSFIYCVLWRPHDPQLKPMRWWANLSDMIDTRHFVDEYHIKKGLGDVQWPFVGKRWKKRSSACLGVREIKRALEERKRELQKLEFGDSYEAFLTLADERWRMRAEWQRLGRGWGTAREVVLRRRRAWDEYDGLRKEWNELNRKSTHSDLTEVFSPHFSDTLRVEEYRALLKQRSEPVLRNRALQTKQDANLTHPTSPTSGSKAESVHHDQVCEGLQIEEDDHSTECVKNTDVTDACLSETESIDIMTSMKRKLSFGKRATDGKAAPLVARANSIVKDNSGQFNSPLRREAILDGARTVEPTSKVGSLRSVSPKPTSIDMPAFPIRRRHRIISNLARKLSRTFSRKTEKKVDVDSYNEGTDLIAVQDMIPADALSRELESLNELRGEEVGQSSQLSDSESSGVQDIVMNGTEDAPESRSNAYIFSDGVWSPASCQKEGELSVHSSPDDTSRSRSPSQRNMWLDGAASSKAPEQIYDECINNPEFIDSASMVSNTTATSMPRSEISVREPRVTGPDAEGYFKIAHYTGPQLPSFLIPECGCKPPRVCSEHIHEWIDFSSRPYTPSEAASWTEVYKKIRDMHRRERRKTLRLLKLRNKEIIKLQQTISDIQSGYRSLKDLSPNEYEVLMTNDVSEIMARGILEPEHQRYEEHIQEKRDRVYKQTERLQELSMKPDFTLSQDEVGELRYLQRRVAKRRFQGFSDGYELARTHAREGKLVLDGGNSPYTPYSPEVRSPLSLGSPLSFSRGNQRLQITMDGTGFSKYADSDYEPPITPTSAASSITHSPISSAPSRDPLENLSRLRDQHRRERRARLAQLKADSQKEQALTRTASKAALDRSLPPDEFGSVLDAVRGERDELEEILRRREASEREKAERYAREEEHYLTLVLKPRDELTGVEASYLKYLRKRVHERCTWKQR
ncbi:hypothetical protein EDC01DRAFT_787762 [Geopyxis carbonaria]|nr:hypothetical protein EDC01DRAFT_787762 [Geopyxis carbonaria]